MGWWDLSTSGRFPISFFLWGLAKNKHLVIVSFFQISNGSLLYKRLGIPAFKSYTCRLSPGQSYERPGFRGSSSTDGRNHSIVQQKNHKNGKCWYWMFLFKEIYKTNLIVIEKLVHTKWFLRKETLLSVSKFYWKISTNLGELGGSSEKIVNSFLFP